MAAYRSVRGSDKGYRGKASPDQPGLRPNTSRKAPACIPMGRIDPVAGSHGFGHSKSQCNGPLRMSGDARAHRVGKGK